MSSQKNFLQRIFPVLASTSVFAAIALAAVMMDRAVQGGTLLWQPFVAITALYAVLFALYHIVEGAAAGAQERYAQAPQPLAA